jgi:hypothetical protein
MALRMALSRDAKPPKRKKHPRAKE